MLAGHGSSPHTRGLLLVGARERDNVRIIPARAGFTVPGLNTCLPVMDHPRTRGVYYPSVRVSGIMSGSSPHTRGLRPHHPHRPAGPRIIPARAGFTRSRHFTPRPRPDHPRTRGVYITRWGERPAGDGSSPHTRGLLRGSGSLSGSWGIIPAHAGFTQCRLLPLTMGVGSSPHTRGLRGYVLHAWWCGGIIPAHAGFTSAPSGTATP